MLKRASPDRKSRRVIGILKALLTGPGLDRVPSTVKCSSERYAWACCSTRWKNFCATSWFSSRSRRTGTVRRGAPGAATGRSANGAAARGTHFGSRRRRYRGPPWIGGDRHGAGYGSGLPGSVRYRHSLFPPSASANRVTNRSRNDGVGADLADLVMLVRVIKPEGGRRGPFPCSPKPRVQELKPRRCFAHL